MAVPAILQSGYAEINGARLYYEIAGEGHPLVLLHAGIADLRMWRGQVADFARHYSVICYDRRGFGRSAMVPGPFSHLHDLHSLLAFLGIERTHLLGCSQGGKIIIDLTLAYSAMVSALVPVTSAPSGFTGGDYEPPQWQEAVSSFEAGDLNRTSELEVQIWVDGPHRCPDLVDPAIRDLVQEMNLIALENEKAALGDEQPDTDAAAARLGEIRVPTLVIIGDLDDPDIVGAGRYMAERVAGASLEIISGTAHLPNMEQPKRFNRLVLDFLSRLPRGSGG